MVNNSTNIDRKANNTEEQPSPTITHSIRQRHNYTNGNPDPSLGQTQQCGGSIINIRIHGDNFALTLKSVGQSYAFCLANKKKLN